MWQQVYDPLNSTTLSALVATVPILFFILGLTLLKMTGLKAALISLLLAVVLGVFIFGLPLQAAAGSILFGFLGGIWPIGWIVLMAVWLYRITVRAGNFDVIRASISSITADQRLQVLLIAFCFGGFLEGAAGFGIPIAICAALLVTLGFDPIKASLVSLISNAAAGAYGAIGIPVIVAAQQGGVAPGALNPVMVPVLQLVATFIPLLLVFILDGMRGVRQTGIHALITGVVFTGLQSLVLVTMGPELVDIIPSLVALVVLAVTAQKIKPAFIYREPNAEAVEALQQSPRQNSMAQIFKAWSPFGILSAMILLWSTPFVKGLFAPADPKTGATAGPMNFTSPAFEIPGLHHEVAKIAPIVANPTPLSAVWTWNLISASGTAILIAALITAATSRITWGETFEELGGAFKQLWKPIVMICLVMAVANVMNYGGMTSSIALALAAAGSSFPFLSPIIGWIGVFVTGSVVNNNTLFAGLQATTATQIGTNPTLLVASNTAGGVMAKIVSPQSIAIAAASVNMAGQESRITSVAIKYSVLLLAVMCVWIFILSLVV